MCVANGNEMSADGAVGGLRLFVVFGHFLLMRTTVSDGWDVPWMRESQPHVYGLRRSIVKAKPAKTTKIALYRSTQTTLFLSPAPLTWTRLLPWCLVRLLLLLLACCCCCSALLEKRRGETFRERPIFFDTRIETRSWSPGIIVTERAYAKLGASSTWRWYLHSG